jgi:hypothetical protein
MVDPSALANPGVTHGMMSMQKLEIFCAKLVQDAYLQWLVNELNPDC